ncbi:phosphatase PAP2 family protein [Streptomyces sp. NPDC051940]|uniref:phosphatase PAP2 family protein n=1 Tax=Streptomyces sp. NPDC051940 TaxID=3155675 RepID=UPI003429A8E5
MEPRYTGAAGAPPAGTGTDVDTSVLRGLNGFADSAPGWLEQLLVFAARFGIIALLVVLIAVCGWRIRRTQEGPRAAGALGALLWAPVAAAVAFAVNIPIKGFVERVRPEQADVEGVDALLASGGWSFVSDHAAVATALAVAAFVAHRGFGAVALVLALLEGLGRIALGVHYPTDVIGGFALGAATALLLAPPAIGRLSSLARRLGLVRDTSPATEPGSGVTWAVPARAGEDDLAA